ncbi:MAG: dynamin family protein [Opitutales bacterium]|nr:dynamin family protein [Opitutales bacterium]
MLDEISQSVTRLYHAALDPVERKFAFEQRPSDGEIAGGPLVLIVGNHSSGKSTFLNHILGEAIQRTGMAPTDDSFTILRHGEKREDRDGNAIVTNPELPFSSLKQFGQDFLSHFRMRLLPMPILKDVTLVDTPGMIDAADPNAGRGYDFEAAVRWFANRADVVLIFFDPDRPGTTAESLTVLTRSLKGMDHKVMVVMNKMDQFRSMRDFARCYGTLCWNLGKVIRKKDIPQIYTTYVPVEGAAEAVLPLDDFSVAREELIDQIRRAPIRRVDNMITHAARHCEHLRMHARVVDGAVARLKRGRKRWTAVSALLVIAAAGSAYYFFQAENWMGVAISTVAAIAVAVGGYFGAREMGKRNERKIINNLDDIFEELYRRELVVENRPEDLLRLWDEVKAVTVRTLQHLGLKAMPRMKNRELKRLNNVLQKDIPEIRSRLHRVLETQGEAPFKAGADVSSGRG